MELMEVLVNIALSFSIFGFVAYVRTAKLIKTLKKKGLLDDDFKAE
jgi:hypothetical protein